MTSKNGVSGAKYWISAPGKEAGGGDDDDEEARPLTQAEAILLLTAPE